MRWFREFLRDYLAWTILDNAVDALTRTTAGKALLTSFVGTVLSALTAAVAYLVASGPVWKYGSVGALVATTLLSILLGFYLLLSRRRALVPPESTRHSSVRKAAPATASAVPLTPHPEERVYLREQSPKEVLEYINSLKPFERAVVSNQSIVGRWVHWSGRVSMIEPFALFGPPGSATVTVSDSELIYARLEFPPAMRHLVEAIEEGDPVDYEARVTRVFDTAIYLTDATVASAKPVVVDVTPEYLWQLFEGRTSTQGQKLVASYIGKWMQVSGPLGDVHTFQATFQHPGAYTGIYMYFRKKKWTDRLSALSPGDNITVRGRIERVSSIDLHLETCELVDSRR